MSGKRIFMALLACIACLVLPGTVLPHQKAPPLTKQEYVLLCINQGQALSPWKLEMYSSCKKELARLFDANVQMSIENLSPKNLEDKATKDFFAKRYRNKVDFILLRRQVSDLAIFEDMFPGVPIIVTNSDVDMVKPADDLQDTYVTETRISPGKTAIAVKRTVPDTSRLIVVHGADPFANVLAELAREDLGTRFKGMDVEYWGGLSLEELLQQSKGLTPEDSILFLSMVLDSAGKHYLSHDVVATLAAEAPVPVFGIASSYFGDSGIVGGYKDSAALAGRRAAATIATIMHGEEHPHLRTLEDYGQYQFDWRKLKQWGISAQAVPADSQILFRPKYFLAQHPELPYIVGAGLLLTLLLASYLVTSYRKRSKLLADLYQSESKYRIVVENMTEGIAIIDENRNMTYLNEPACKMVGRSNEEMLRLKAEDLMPPHELAKFRERFAARKEGDSKSYPLTLMHSDGREVPTLISPAPLFDADNTFRGSVSILTDLTELKRLESELQQAQKLEAIGQLAAGIAHEINTPAQYVTANVHFLKSAWKELLSTMDREEMDLTAANPELAGLVEEVPDAFAETEEGLGRISEIVRSVKSFAHPGATERKPENINAAVKNAIAISSTEWKYVAELETRFAEDLPLVSCNIGEFLQVLLNLIVNAGHAIEQQNHDKPNAKGQITITTEHTEPWVVIRVRDNGIGMDEETRNKIFEPFFTTKEVGKGTGQGLAICHTIITENHGGELTFTSDRGEGSEFVIKLPLDHDQEQ